MAKFDNDIIKAREIVENYNKHNLNTVETLSSYDTVTRTRYYKKVVLDVNAHEFKEKFIESKKKKKSTSEVRTKPIITKTTLVKRNKKEFVCNPNSMQSKVYDLHLKGLSNEDIASRLNTNKRTVSMAISARKHKLGLTKNQNETFEKVKDLYSQGFTPKQISEKLNRSQHNISYHIKKINKRTPEIKEKMLKDRKCIICENDYVAVSAKQKTCSKECRRKYNNQQVRDYRLNKKLK